MPQVLAERVTASIDRDIVVFLIGMRINRLWKIHKWLPVALAMPRMVRELYADPSSGFLGAHAWFGITTVMLQYWRSFDHLERGSAHRRRRPLPHRAQRGLR